MKKILFIVFICTGSVQAMNEGKVNIKLSEESESSGHSLFKIDTKISEGQINLAGNYQFNAAIDKTSKSLFETRIKDLFSSFSHREKQGPRQSYIKFNDEDNLKLGIDLNFTGGKVLSNNTVITKIWKNEGSRVIDGKIDNSIDPVDSYSVSYKIIDESDREHTIRFGVYMMGSLETNTHIISFEKDWTSKTEIYKIDAINKKLRPKRKPRDQNDRVIIDLEKEGVIEDVKKN